MKHTITRALVAVGAAALALTACAADDGSAADRHEQQHIEQLQDAHKAQQMKDYREAYDAMHGNE
jgi:ABC-type glycerol-3-phosphate transport system substrate-binding protein